MIDALIGTTVKAISTILSDEHDGEARPGALGIVEGAEVADDGTVHLLVGFERVGLCNCSLGDDVEFVAKA